MLVSCVIGKAFLSAVTGLNPLMTWPPRKFYVLSPGALRVLACMDEAVRGLCALAEEVKCKWRCTRCGIG